MAPSVPPNEAAQDGIPGKAIRSKARATMDQQNLTGAEPASADPAVVLAKALGQWPNPEPAKPKLNGKTSVLELAQELGLKLGDQNELTIRRIKRGKGYSFVRANGAHIRDARTIRRLHAMAVPPAYRE